MTIFMEITVLLPCYQCMHVGQFSDGIASYIVRHVVEGCNSETPCFFISIPTKF